jgi:DNA-binding NarL/FixJ family response regulator
MPGLSGVEVTRRLIERTPASRVLVVSVSAQEEDVTEAILAGASGYVLKDVRCRDQRPRRRIGWDASPASTGLRRRTPC